MNRVILSGRLATDPNQVSDKLTSFRVAVDDYNSQTQQREASFFGCKAFGSSKAFVDQYLKKGDFAIIEGRLSTSKRNVSGVEREFTDILVDRIEGGPRPKAEDAAPTGW